MEEEILTPAERLRFDELPPQISESDVVRYFTLSPHEIALALTFRGAVNQIGFALQLCTLRYIGRFPTDTKHVNRRVIEFIARQLDVSVLSFDYPIRERTKWEHQEKIRQLTGFRTFDEATQSDLSVALKEQAFQCNQSSALMAFAREKLYQDRIIRPPANTLERLIAHIKKQTDAEIFSFLYNQLDETMKQNLSKLLVVEEGEHFSPLQSLKKPPPLASPNALLALMRQMEHIQGIGIDTLDFSRLSENKLKYLAQLGKGYSTSPMLRFQAEKRYSLMACFLKEKLTETIDTSIDMYDALITAIIRRSQNDLDNLTQEVAKEKNELVILLKDLGTAILDEHIEDGWVRQWIYTEIIPRNQLKQKVETCELLARPADYNCLDFVETRYNYTRQFSPRFLETLVISPTGEEDDLFRAVQLIRQWNQENQRKIPPDAPTGFVPKSWMEPMKQADGTLDRHFYELCALVKLRDALRAGDIWVSGSRRYLPIMDYLFDDDHWKQNREKYYQQLGLPQDPHHFLAQVTERFATVSQRVEATIPHNPFAAIEDGILSVSREKGEPQSNEVDPFRRSVLKHLPRIKLPELLIEVDKWTHFTQYFTPLFDSAGEKRTTTWKKSLFANLVAQGCNIGLDNMADSTPDITYRQLFHVSTWYLHEDSLRKAISEIINFQHRLPLASLWGDGTKSTSDGMRFNVPVNAFGAEFHPKYFGKYGRGITRYSFLSDQFTEFDTIIIPSTLREAPYVLDGLLHNETDLDPQQHFTDEHGYTENVFALAELLGYRFCPRFKDLAGQNIYKLDSGLVFKQIEPLFRDSKTNRLRRINISLIIEQWDNIVRMVASLKNRKVTASRLLSKMEAYSRSSRLLAAIT